LLTDRFYRRYLRESELEPASNLMTKIKKIFSGIASNEVDWGQGIQGDINKTWLDARLSTLDLIFSKYFDNFDNAVNSALYVDRADNGNYFPVRLSMSNGIIFVVEKMRPLNQYNELTTKDEPFWLLSEDDFNKSLSYMG